MDQDKPRLYIEDSGGDGRPVVLIHGWPLSGAAWKPQLPALIEAGFRVITYDRRGFGQSEAPGSGYDYDHLAEDLAQILEDLDLQRATLVGFSMGGGEVVRYLAKHGGARVNSAVLAAAVPPFMMKGPDNPEGPLDPEAAQQMERDLKQDRERFFQGFTKDFFSAHGELKVSEAERQEAVALCRQSDEEAALGCMEAFGTTDFREDLKKISCPVLVLHGDADGIVPIEGSGQRSYELLETARLRLLAGAPHGCNVSHAEAFNRELIEFLNS